MRMVRSVNVLNCAPSLLIIVSSAQENNEKSIKDCTKAVELKPTYVKALLRRAELYEKTEKLDEALEDYQQLLQLDPSLGVARQACMVCGA